jgi:hypothetical protein
VPHGIEHLLPGDILLYGGHTMMYIGLNRLVHAMPAGGLVRVNMLNGNSQGIWDGASVFRPRSPHLGTCAAEFAASWAPSTSSGATGYAPNTGTDEVINNRGTGVKQQLKLGVAAPFEYDALYRSLKWALLYGGVFSENRGTTCCAVIIAAYHAASVFYWTEGTTPEERLERIQTQYEWLRDNRGAKKPSKIIKTTSQGDLSNKAFREVSNRGQGPQVASMDFLTIARSILADLAGEEVELEQVYTPALLLDAKYTHSSTLLTRLRQAANGWEPRADLEYNPQDDPFAGMSTSDRLMAQARLGQ